MMYNLKQYGLLMPSKKLLHLKSFKQIINYIYLNKYFSSTPGNYRSDSENDFLVVEQIRTTRVIGINRPDKGNCINNATAKALLQAFKDFDADENSQVAVLHGVGGNFCEGYDLEELSASTDISSETKEQQGFLGLAQYETTKPVIAAVDGFAIGGGLELALWCDARIVEDTAVMGVLYGRRYGVPLIDGGTVRLPAMVGVGRALDLILTGRPVRAPEALQIGLATQICACGSAIGRAVFYANGINVHPQEALKADRVSARRAFFVSSTEEALRKEFDRGMLALKEAQIGASKFVAGEGRHGMFKSKQLENALKSDA